MITSLRNCEKKFRTISDVKTGQASLTYEQRWIKQGIEKGLVRFETIRM